jgi:hypothetical protein
VVDEAGDVVEAYDYYPFGLQSRSYKEKGDPLTKETFTGKEAGHREQPALLSAQGTMTPGRGAG